MFGTHISMYVLIQYGLQTANGLLITEVRAFLAKSASMTCISHIQFCNDVMSVTGRKGCTHDLSLFVYSHSG